MKSWLYLWTFVFSCGAYGKILVSSDPYPPLIYQQGGTAVGLIPEILPKILDIPADKIEYRFSPWKRVLSDAERGSVDVIGPLLSTPERGRYLVFTEPLIVASISLWVRRDNPKLKDFLNEDRKIRDFKELRGLRFGQILGYSFENSFGNFFNRPDVQKIEVVDMEQGVRMLTSRRIDVFLAYDPVIEYYIENLKMNKNDFATLGEASKEVMYVMGISKKSPLVGSLAQINKRITAYRSTKRLKK